MTVLVAFERSGRIRDALLAQGIDAVSCDVERSDRPGPHIQDDVMPLLRQRWDMVIAHPVCRYLANSGMRWLYEHPARWHLMLAGAQMFREVLEANAPRVAIENSVMHKHARKIIGQQHSFSTQPWMFGDNFTKRSLWWAKGLPPLQPTSDLDGSTAYPKCHWMPPGQERERLRAETEPGLAMAVATQWGSLVSPSRGR